MCLMYVYHQGNVDPSHDVLQHDSLFDTETPKSQPSNYYTVGTHHFLYTTYVH